MARKRALFAVLAVAGAAAALAATARSAHEDGRSQNAATPIQHVVVIFQENVSFDHYFGTYPYAANTDGTTFTPKTGTPDVDGLSWSLLAANPNASNPKRLDSTPTGAPGSPGGQLTCDQDHNYSDEQQSFDGGKMDQFVQSVGTSSGTAPGTTNKCDPNAVMDYYDGNSVTGLWNYAQNYAMSDNSFETTFGPSAPGAINLVSGDTGSVDMAHTANNPSIATAAAPNADLTPDGKGGYSLTSDAQPYWDDCSTRDAVALNGQNIGDLLNRAGISWGWFQGGYRPTTTFSAAATATGHAGQSTATFIPDEFAGAFTGKNVPAHASNQALCDAVHPVGAASGGTGQYGFKDDYIAHHEPFDYYASTANPHHLVVPTDTSGNDTLAGLSSIGRDTQSYVHNAPQFDTPNHQYDTSDFDQLVAAITAGKLSASQLPAVSFIKAPGYEDGHAAYSDPADEQAFIVHVINELEQSPAWSSTAVFVNYDDSDGWYDHVYSGVTNPSASPADNLTNTVVGKGNGTSGQCGNESPGRDSDGRPLANEQGRCGFGARLPMLVVSPWAKSNYVDHNLSDQTSIVNFVEYNWRLPSIQGSFDDALQHTDEQEHIRFDLAGLFDFGSAPSSTPVILDPVTGQKQ
ncbi:MAG: alkaline phosphatase family protein [Actinomycetota bacterium]